jgi:hypothetical protein
LRAPPDLAADDPVPRFAAPREEPLLVVRDADVLVRREAAVRDDPVFRAPPVFAAVFFAPLRPVALRVAGFFAADDRLLPDFAVLPLPDFAVRVPRPEPLRLLPPPVTASLASAAALRTARPALPPSSASAAPAIPATAAVAAAACTAREDAASAIAWPAFSTASEEVASDSMSPADRIASLACSMIDLSLELSLPLCPD